jgi:hypothetical protein
LPGGGDLDPRELYLRDVQRRKVDVVAHVVDVPVERRSVRQHTQRVVMDVDPPSDELDHQAMAARIVEGEMYGGRDVPELRGLGAPYLDARQRGLKLGNGGEVAQRPVGELRGP